jgi:YVTN family beta-propeller protein
MKTINAHKRRLTILEVAFIISVLIISVLGGFYTVATPENIDYTASQSNLHYQNFDINNTSNENASVQSAGTVIDTLDLSNDTVLQGNFVNTTNNILSPYDGVYNPINKLVYVIENSGTEVSLFNSSNNNLIKNIQLFPKNFSSSSSQIFFNPVNGNVYVEGTYYYYQMGYSYLIEINSTTGVITKLMPNYSIGVIAYDPFNHYFYACDNYYSGSVDILNPNLQLVSRINVNTNYITSMIYDPVTHEILGAGLNYLSPSLLVINSTTNETSSYTVGTSQSDLVVLNSLDSLAFDPTNNLIYFAEGGSGDIIVLSINPTSVSVIKTIHLEPGVGNFAVVSIPNSQLIYLSDSISGNNLTAMNITTDKVVENITIPSSSTGMVYDPDSDFLYVLCGSANTIALLDLGTNSIVRDIVLGYSPSEMAFDPLNNDLYVINEGTNEVWVINGTSYRVESIVHVGWGPDSIVCDPFNGNIYVMNSYSDNISVIDGVTNEIETSIQVQYSPGDAVYDPFNHYIYIATNEYTIYSLDPSNNTVSRIGAPPYNINRLAYDDSNHEIYASQSWGIVAINVSTDQVSSSISLGNVQSITYDSSNGLLYTTEMPDELVVLNSTLQIVSNIAVSQTPSYLFYNPKNTFVYLINSFNSTITAINGSSDQSSGNVEVGSSPSYMTYDSVNGYLFVSNSVSGTISIISTTNFHITVNETGLPTGTLWYFNLSNKQSYSSNSNYVTFTEPNGSYTFTISTIDKEYAPTVPSGNITIEGSNSLLKISFIIAMHKIIFTESGLPSGTLWYVNLSNGQYFSSLTSTITFNESYGNYSYTIATTNKTYSPSPSSSFFIVEGASVSNSITFSLVTYRVTFSETGLPYGTTWYVNLSNGQTYYSSTNTITFSLSNGTYSFNIAVGNKGYRSVTYSGSFTVNGSPVSESVAFSQVTYTVTFTETRLPSGTSWFVTLNGATESSTTNTLTFSEPNGTYTYTIQSIAGYRTSTYAGTIIVNGNAVTNNIVWSIITYPISITQSGIPSGTSWSVTLNGTTFNGQSINVTLNSTTNTITFNEPNGTYTYTVHLPSGYTSSNTKGSKTVSGASATAVITVQPSTNYLLYIIIVIVVIIVVIGVVMVMRRGKNKGGPKQ